MKILVSIFLVFYFLNANPFVGQKPKTIDKSLFEQSNFVDKNIKKEKKKVKKETEKTTQTYKLQAIIGNFVFLNDSWHEFNQTLDGQKIIKIDNRNIVLKSHENNLTVGITNGF